MYVCKFFERRGLMFLTWEEAKAKFPNKWVVFKNPRYNDVFHMDLIGGEFAFTAGNQDELFDLINEDLGLHTARHTGEDDAVGLLLSGY